MSGTHDDVVACVRPLLFENKEFDDYPYSVQSTGFLLRYQSTLFVITAKHALKGRKPSELFVLSSATADTALPFLEMGVPNAMLEEHQDALDFVYFRIAEERMNPQDVSRLAPWWVEPGNGMSQLSSNDILYFRGHPWLDQDIDYENRRIGLRSMDSSAFYHGASIFPNCHSMRLHEIHAKTLDGFSGSPVFKVTWKKTGEKHFEMIGMVIRGTIESGIAHFTDIRWILGCLDYYLAR
mgnify:CR=1 FL=1